MQRKFTMQTNLVSLEEHTNPRSNRHELPKPGPDGITPGFSPEVPSASALDWALAYAHHGWPVFPLVPRDKTPLIATKQGGRGFHDATTDVDQIRSCWTAHPDANIGIPTGPISGIVAVDVDGPIGDARLRESLGGVLPTTLTNVTSPGHYQLIFAYPQAGLPSPARQLG